MPAVGALFALLFALSILGTIGLWYAIDRETADSGTMTRGDAERAARQDTPPESRENEDQKSGGRESEGRDADDWGTDAEWGVDDGDDGDRR